MNAQPTNVYHWDILANETELADDCKQYGYILLKFINPSGTNKPNNGYYLVPEGGAKVAGFIYVGGNVHGLHMFNGTFGEFMESLATYDERYQKWYGEQIRWATHHPLDSPTF